MLFCYYCGTHLIVKLGDEGYRFSCQTCPYEYPIDRKIYHRTYMPGKRVDDVLGGAGSWDNVDATDALCPRNESEQCEGRRAYFFQLQIRSADEPMTTFYKCVVCGHQWREG